MGSIEVAIARADDVIADAIHPVELNGRPMLVAAIDDNAYVVFARACPHQGVDLLDGTIEEHGVLRCPQHSYSFDLATGACVRPSNGPPLVVLRARRRGHDIVVDLEW